MEITPHTRVGALLDAHPELEETLIAAVPEFAKLRNPILRATVAKLATLEQAAKVGGIPLPDLIALIRKALGQEGLHPVRETASPIGTTWPPWYREAAVKERLDVASVLGEGGHPFAKAKTALSALAPGAIVLLTSEFEPAPLLGQALQEGLLAACIRTDTGFQTALRRP